MNKKTLILKYFQKKDQLTVVNREYQHTLSSLFNWLVANDKVADDRTSKYFPNIFCEAKIIAKEAGILAGIEEISFLLEKYTHLTITPLIRDGSAFKNGDTIAQLEGKSHEILGYERTILNFLQRMSGIATETNRIINIIKAGAPPYIAATRKTPWISLDKKAVAAGGGLTHRLNLSDGILIKDNHLKVISKAKKTPQVITEALKHLLKKSENAKEQLIEIEVDTEGQAKRAIKTFQKLTTNYQLPTTNHFAILLDNFTPSRVKHLLSNLRNSYDLSSIIFEASGGINGGNVRQWAKTGADILSLGALTHSSSAINISLEF